MSPQADISNWPNIDKVAAMTGISRRTLEREQAAGKWQVQKRPRPGARPEVVFDPEQVAARMPPPRTSVMRAAPEVPATVPADTAMVAETMAETEELPITWPAIAEVIATVVQQVMAAPLPEPEPETLFVGLEEASQITGLSESCLRGLVKEGRLGHIPDWSKSRHKVPMVRRTHLHDLCDSK